MLLSPGGLSSLTVGIVDRGPRTNLHPSFNVNSLGGFAELRILSFKLNSVGGGFPELRTCFELNSMGGGCPELGICFQSHSIGGALRSSVAVLNRLLSGISRGLGDLV